MIDTQRDTRHRPISELLAHLREQDIVLWVDGDRLRFSAQPGALTSALRQELGERKSEILNFLQSAKAIGEKSLPPIPPADRDQPLPVSFAQQRLWFLDQLQPGNSFYNIATELHLTGLLNTAALEHSLNAMVRRHEVLRTTFATIDGMPIQIIAPAAPIDLPLVDLQPVAAAERETALRQFLHDEGLKPFDLTHGPLMRFTLIRLTLTEHVLLVASHHIVVDAWSDDVLIRELATCYAAYLAGQPDAAESQLPALPIQYADFAAWQRQWLQGEVVQTQLAYWRRQLEGMSPILELPTDRPRPPVQSFRGAFHEFALPQPLAAACTALSLREGCTLFMTCLAAFQVLLYRYTGQTDISIGSPIANRGRPEIEHLIGFFTNTLVLRANLEGNPSFRDLLRQVRDVTLNAYAHQDLPFELLVEELRPERDLSRTPLFQVMFVLRNTSKATFELPGIDLSLLEGTTGTAKFDLTLFLTETDGALSGGVEYNTDLFDATTIGRLVQHFQTLLEHIVIEPTQRISRLPLLAPSERQYLIQTWNATQVDYPEQMSIHQLVEAQVERTPDAPAALFGDRQLTYQQLNCRANQLAHYLHRLGVGPDSCVGIYLERSLELPIAVLAVLKAGAAYVPLDSTYPHDRLAFMMQDTRTPVLLTHTPLVDSLPAPVANVICLDRDWSTIAQEPSDNPDYGVTSSNLAYIIYTSGSTGIPKGVAMGHRPLVNLLAWQLQYSTLPGPTVTLQFAPLSFDASFQEMFSTWWVGGTLVLMPAALRQDPVQLLELMERQRVERLFLPFVALQQLAEVIDAGQARLPSALREIVTAGEQLYITDSVARLFERMRNGILYNYYGPSETHVVTALTLTGSPRDWPVLPSIGRPIGNTQMYILDEHGEPMPVGIPGELYIGGVSLADGYLDRPAITAQKFIPDPFATTPGARLYRSGDLARWLPDGTIAFLGRIDHQVKIRGYRVELGEIEAALMQHPQVREAAVVVHEGSGHSSGDKRLVAYLVPDARAGLSPEQRHLSVADLTIFLRQMMPEYMVPAAFVFLERIPVTPSGKLNRRALPAPEFVRSTAAQVLPRDVLELRLALIWQDLLAISPIGVTDNFFEIGGHSLLAVRLQTQIQQQLGQHLPLAIFFQNPTIGQLAARLRQPGASPVWSPVVTLQPHGTQPPLFCVHGGDGSALSFMAVAQSLGASQPCYGFQAAGLEGEQPPCDSIPDMAARYVAALREIQPHGPYHLAGWSVGGVIAFEMARQLESQGHMVALLALLDSQADQYFDPAQRPALDDARVLAEFLEEMGGSSGRRFGESIHELAALEPDARFERLVDEARRCQIVPADVELTHIRQRLAVFQANLRALEQYTPQMGRQRLTLLRAMGESYPVDRDPSLGWAALTSGGIEIIDVPGTHYSMIAPPHVTELAEQLRHGLDALKGSGLRCSAVGSAHCEFICRNVRHRPGKEVK
jgi:amino acid adenylation domain-containing protein